MFNCSYIYFEREIRTTYCNEWICNDHCIIYTHLSYDDILNIYIYINDINYLVYRTCVSCQHTSHLLWVSSGGLVWCHKRRFGEGLGWRLGSSPIPCSPFLYQVRHQDLMSSMIRLFNRHKGENSVEQKSFRELWTIMLHVFFCRYDYPQIYQIICILLWFCFASWGCASSYSMYLWMIAHCANNQTNKQANKQTNKQTNRQTWH